MNYNSFTVDSIKQFHVEYHDNGSSLETKQEIVERLIDEYIKKLDPYYEPIGTWQQHLQHDWTACFDAYDVETQLKRTFTEILMQSTPDASLVKLRHVCNENLAIRVKDINDMIRDNYRRPNFVIDMSRISETFVEHVINDIRYLAHNEWRKAKVYVGRKMDEVSCIVWVRDESSPQEYRSIIKSKFRTKNAYIDIRYETSCVHHRGIVIDIRSCESIGRVFDKNLQDLSGAERIVLRMTQDQACKLLDMLDSMLEKPYIIRAEIRLIKFLRSLRNTAKSTLNCLKHSWRILCAFVRNLTPSKSASRTVFWSIIGSIIGGVVLALLGIPQSSC